jgi:hypothetical protein
MNTLRFTFRSIFFTAVLCLFVIGCNSQFATTVRKVTYPPDFNYTVQADLRTDMGKLAQQMVLLEQALASKAGDDNDAREKQRQQVLFTLRNMERIATSLKAGNTGANHPFMQDYMQDFIAKIDQARGGAAIEPPRYFYAGKLSGGCTNCHKVNR